MRKFGAIPLLLSTVILGIASHASSAPGPEPTQRGEELAISSADVGQYGGMLVVGQRAEPKTLNPLTATDAPSREVIGRMMADLVHINRVTQQTEPALASSWKLSTDGRSFTVKLRRGVRFSDGYPFSADDVVFSFRLYLDEKIRSSNRDLLIIGGKPISAVKIDDHTVRFDMSQPYAAAERIFDNLAILPEHLLRKSYEQGSFAQALTLNTAPDAIAGLGPFRLKQYLPGQRLVLERNPYYWKADRNHRRLPYLDEIAFLFVGNEDAQILRFQSGETNVISRFSPENYSALAREQQSRGYDLVDLGPSLEYNFLFFNLNELPADQFPAISRKQEWFRDVKFRQAVSLAVDRQSIVKLVYNGRGTALWGNVTPGNKLWINRDLPHPERSIPQAKELLKSAGFSWDQAGKLFDTLHNPVEFTIITSSSNAQRVKMATLIADDLAQLGMSVHVVPLEFRAVMDRVFQSTDYEASVFALGGGDADPNGDMNVWMSNGSTHLWNMHESKPATAWEAQLDALLNQQLVTLNYKKRKQLYDEAQAIIAHNLPFIFLASPNVVVGATKQVANFRPAALEPYVLWNVDELYLRQEGVAQAK
ncbi:MAG TPA: ABC transporter substrate-binding protein [Terriglobales bacterium]|jgi:peptide/nickel transport system substrate-binding protein|nr:ABC transporter substrate-binding protein [Terriglobales bacterium]